MQDCHIGEVRVTRIEEQMGAGFPAKDFFPEFDADTFAAEGHWLAPNYYQPESGRLIGWIDLAGLLPAVHRLDPEAVLNGIAYDRAGDRLFVTGKLWPKLFEVKVRLGPIDGLTLVSGKPGLR